jgi:crossover junction endodeoxyribonuclease RuvC
MFYIGIDPGKTGGISILKDKTINTNRIYYSDEMPVNIKKEIDSFKIFHLLWDLRGDKQMSFCVLERAQSMPKQGVKSTFNYGVGYGEIKSILKILEIPFQEVSPVIWKKEFSLIKKTKMDSADVASKLFPGLDFFTERKRLKDGMAESLLLAEYAKRIFDKTR